MNADRSVDLDRRIDAPLDIEKELINHLSDSESVKLIVREGFNTDLLNNPNNRAVVGFAVHYYNTHSKAPNSQVLLTEFARLELSEPVAGIDWVIEKLRERFKRNSVQRLVRKATDNIGDPDEVLRILRTETNAIERDSATEQFAWGPGDHSYFISQIQEKIIAGQYRGMSLGFKEIDAFTGGMKPGYLTGLAARPKRQKTFFLLQAFISQILAGLEPILFTLENTEIEVWQRMACMISGFPWDKMQRGEVMPADWKMIEEKMSDFDSVGRYKLSRPPVGERSVPQLMLLADKFNANSVLLSQFRYIEAEKDFYRADNEKWASIVLDLKLAATKQGSERPIYVETQLTREANSMTEMMDADLSLLGLTDMWGQAADLIMCLYQNRDLRASGVTEFGIIEARNSDKSSWLVESEFKTDTSLRIVRDRD